MRDSYDERVAAGFDPETLYKEVTIRQWIAARRMDMYAAETLPSIEPKVKANIAMKYALLQKKVTGREPTTYILDIMNRESENDLASTSATAVVVSADEDHHKTGIARAYTMRPNTVLPRDLRETSHRISVSMCGLLLLHKSCVSSFMP